MVQRIDEVPEVYVQTLFTIGSTQWQKIRHVFIPAVFSKIATDIVVLVALSWTYITTVEIINKEGGLGTLMWIFSRQGRTDKVFGIILLIVFIGFLQDKIARFIIAKTMPYAKEARKD